VKLLILDCKVSVKTKFNLDQIIKMAYAKYPSQKRMDVIKALKSADESWWISDNYLSFYHPLKHTTESHHKERIAFKVLGGNIYIDLLQKRRIRRYRI